VNAANDPIIIVDGVRINAEHLAGRDPNLPGVNNRPSRIDDIDPTIIESIEVLNGPSASSLYGSDAANGIIVIKTKRGRPGPARWSFNGEHIESRMAISLPPTSYGYGHGLMGDGWRGCTLWDQASGNCAVLDSVKTFNVFSNKSTTPFGTGHFTRVGGNVSGGSEAVQYFVSGSYIDDLGLTRLPKHNEEVISRAHGGAAVPGYLRRPNTQNEAHVMGNVVARLNEQLDVRLVSQFTRLNNRRGNDGVGQSAFMTLFDPSDSTALVGGWEQFFVERSDQVTRSSNTVSATWQPRSWLMGRGAYGYDYSVTNDTELNRRDSCMPRCGWSQGYPDSVGSIRFGNRTSVVQNVDLRATATWPLLNELTMRTSTGMQYVRSTMRDLNGWAFDLPRGRTSVAGASGQKQIDEVSDDVATAGWYLEQSAAFREKLFATAGFRRDAGSAFGDRVSPIYPKWSLSYLASSEPFFAPIRPWIGTLRLRGAYGHAGIQPPTTNRLRLYGQFGRFVRPDGTLESYTYMSSIGNGELRPERSVELEWGFDVDAFDGRVRAELTSFRKTTRDAVVNRPLAPSLGYSTRRENVGTVRNTGLEAVVSGTILRDGFATWDVSVGYASRQNKLIELGPNVAPFSVANGWGYNDYGRVVEGYPLFGRWMKPVVGYHDANGDGIIGFEEVRMGDSLVYMGASEPKYQMSMNHNIGLFRNRVRLTASFQFVGDFVQVNSFLQQISWRIPSAYDRNLGTPQQQAYMHMGFWGAQYGFVERTNTLRLNSLGIQMTLPDAITRSLRATRADLTLMGSNLGVWTSYKGADPALNSAGALGNRVVDDGGLAMPRSLGIRVNLSY
jgi:TonB-dependent SusC/RagA subfamily outer membrane receptor